MATSNISHVTTANTFDQWRIITNDLIGVANTLINGTEFLKPNGNFTVANGTITANNFSATYNVTAAHTITTGNLIVTGTATFGGASLGTIYSTANSSANTVSVSANSGSILSKQKLNFVNTATVLVNVVAGISGNANVSFDVIGGGGGGGGAQGAQGTQGTQGTQGRIGSQGVQGTQGLIGTGSQGIQGLEGSGGPAGPSGLQGAQGTVGSAGSITDNTTSGSTFYPILTTSTSGALSGVTVSSTKLSFVPSSGTVTATDFAATSDSRLKDILGTVPNAVAMVNNLKGVEYTWNETAKNIGISDDTRLQVGLIAQDVANLYPTLVYTNPSDEYLRVSYGRVVAVLVEAIKELDARVKELENK